MDKEALLIAAILAIGAGVMIPNLEGPKDRTVAVVATDLPQAAAIRPAIPVSAVPVQASIAPFDVDLGFGFHGVTTHRYSLAGQVLVRRPYTWDATAKISPVDLAIGWADMARPQTLDEFMFAGGKRAVHIRARDQARALGPIMSMWSNTHVIPASDAVREIALALEPGQHVRLHGYLIEVSGPGGLTWEGSTSRDDRGYVACEIMLVERIEIIGAEAAQT